MCLQQCLVTRQVHLRHPWVGYSCWSFSNRCSLRLASLPLCGAYHSVIPGMSTTCKQIAILILRCNTLGWFRLQHAPRRVLLIVPISSLLSVFKLIVRITISQRRACERGSIACCPYEGRSSKFGLGSTTRRQRCRALRYHRMVRPQKHAESYCIGVTATHRFTQCAPYRRALEQRHAKEHVPLLSVIALCSLTSLSVLAGYRALQGRCSPASYRSIMTRTFSVLFAALVALQLCALVPVAVADHAGHDHSAHTTDDAGAHHSHSCPSFRLLILSLRWRRDRHARTEPNPLLYFHTCFEGSWGEQPAPK